MRPSERNSKGSNSRGAGLFDDTIVAIATPPGKGTCAILRLSGPEAISAASLRLRPALNRAEPLQSIPCTLKTRNSSIPVRVVTFRAPRSYTREGLVEIFLPGSPPLAAAALTSLLEGDVGNLRLARPGEFTFRAFRSGRIDLSQAEAVAQLIGATSEAEEKAAERQLRGELRSRVEEIAGEIVSALALVEGALDFPEEDLESIDSKEIQNRITKAASQMDALRTASSLRLPDTGAIRAALAGFPNAGKSSLLNALLKKPAAIVTEFKGTTRDPVRGIIAGPGGRQIEWIDLAGFEVPPPRERDAPDGRVEDLQSAISRLTRVELETADLIVWVVDGADQETCQQSLALFQALQARRKFMAINKADLLTPREIETWKRGPERPEVVSALTGEGLECLTSRILQGSEARESPQFLITARQEAAIDRAKKILYQGKNALERGEGYDLVSVDLREALGFLDEITGREVGEKVLESIFSRFCIGK